MMPMEITPFIPLILRGIIKERIFILGEVKRLLIFERELAGKTELLRFWKSQTVKSVKKLYSSW